MQFLVAIFCVGSFCIFSGAVFWVPFCVWVVLLVPDIVLDVVPFSGGIILGCHYWVPFSGVFFGCLFRVPCSDAFGCRARVPSSGVLLGCRAQVPCSGAVLVCRARVPLQVQLHIYSVSFKIIVFSFGFITLTQSVSCRFVCTVCPDSSLWQDSQ